jgi:hypothetical protein
VYDAVTKPLMFTGTGAGPVGDALSAFAVAESVAGLPAAESA